MNQKVLEAIIQLLAIIANIDNSTGNKRNIIAKFLKYYVNEFEMRKAIFLFDEYTAFAKDAGLKEARRVAKELNADLTVKQRVFIMVHLVEMVLADQDLSVIEDGFMRAVCEAFNLPFTIYEDIQEFIWKNDSTELLSSNILLINNKSDSSKYRVRHLSHAGLDVNVAVLRVPEADMMYLRIMQPTDDLFINGEQLNWELIYLLNFGTVIKGTEIEPLYFSEIIRQFLPKVPEQQISFEAENLCYTFADQRQGLYQVNVAEESGRLVALMGASGSGKSTLLNVLNGSIKPDKGTVKINGVDIYRYKEEIQGIIGYVPQDDLLIEALTVYQNLYFAARLCFGNATHQELDDRVNQTLRSLGLFEIKDLKVGSPLEKTISGGQRKRLNIGLELLRQPAILFVDEPTSGLSSRDSENIIDLLRQLTFMGKLVFVVIHQPSAEIFKMFDRLLILDTGGYPIFYGSPIDSLSYFRSVVNQIDKDEESACPTCGHINVEEIFKIIERKLVDEYGNDSRERKTPPKVWHSYFLQKIKLPKVPKVLTFPHSSLAIPPVWSQAVTFMQRDLLAKLKNTQYMVINLIEAPLLALILAFIVRYYQQSETDAYWFSNNQNIPAYIFMSVIVALFMGLTLSAEEIIKDAGIRKREAFLQLSKSSYLISKIVILFGISAIQTAMYTVVGNLILGIEGMYLMYWAVFFSCACFANVLGLNISATFNSVITIYILIPLLLIPQLILGGVVIKYDEINPWLANKKGSVPLIAELITSRWAFEAIVVGQYTKNMHQREFYEFDKQNAICEYKRVYYLPYLRSTLDEAAKLQNSFDSQEKFERNLTLLQNELRKENEAPHGLLFSDLELLAKELFTARVAGMLGNHLDSLGDYYQDWQQAVSKAKDRKLKSLTGTPEKLDLYLENMRRHHNEAIATLVNNKSEVRIVESEGHLIQKIYPIYLDPPAGRYEIAFNAHFYAPVKFFVGYFIHTLYYNLLIIWAMTAILFIALYFNILRQLLEGYDSLFKKKNE